METLNFDDINFNGISGKLLRNITKNWLLGIRETNPAILDIFAERDLTPYRDLLPWSGEFAGKYITGAYYTYKLNRDPELYNYILSFIDELIAYQSPEGYLGCYSCLCRLTGAFSQNHEVKEGTWDAWSHYHIMYGLLLWYDLTSDITYYNAVIKAADFFIYTFYNEKTGNLRLVDIGSSEMNLAPYHIFALLYNKTKENKYLDFAKKIEEDFEDDRAGNYIECAFSGVEFYQCPKPRWESIHIILGIAQMYTATGEERYLTAAVRLFYSILKTDIHNTGAFSTNEQACGSPFRDGAIETCCVVAYNALASDIYKLTKDPKIIDFLELSHYNAIMGSFNPSGHWSTYHTPMEGSRAANFHSINFQSRPGSPELNCCSVNAPRGASQIGEWMITAGDDNTIYINSYESCKITTDDEIKISVKSNYPVSGKIYIDIESVAERNIALRIPKWSKKTKISYTSEDSKINCNPEAGSYYIISAVKKLRVSLTLDFSVYFLTGDEAYTGKYSIYYGPVLYGIDVPTAAECGIDYNNLPVLSDESLRNAKPSLDKKGRITVNLMENITLCDFYHLGVTGAEYKTFFAKK